MIYNNFKDAANTFDAVRYFIEIYFIVTVFDLFNARGVNLNF